MRHQQLRREWLCSWHPGRGCWPPGTRDRGPLAQRPSLPLPQMAASTCSSIVFKMQQDANPECRAASPGRRHASPRCDGRWRLDYWRGHNGRCKGNGFKTLELAFIVLLVRLRVGRRVFIDRLLNGLPLLVAACQEQQQQYEQEQGAYRLSAR